MAGSWRLGDETRHGARSSPRAPVQSGRARLEPRELPANRNIGGMRAVWKFLVHDSNIRKAGKNKAKWKAHRTKLLKDFKKEHPKHYKELYEKE